MASTTLITNVTTVLSNGPSSVTKANAIAQAGPILGYPDLTQSALLALQEANVKITALLAATDASSDAANYTLLSNVLASLS